MSVPLWLEDDKPLLWVDLKEFDEEVNKTGGVNKVRIRSNC